MSKEALSRPDVPFLKVKGHVFTAHAQNRIAKYEIHPRMLYILLKKLERTGPYDEDNDSYEKFGKRVTICVAAGTNRVKTLYEPNAQDAKKYNIQKEPLSNRQKSGIQTQKIKNKSGSKTSTRQSAYRTTAANKTIETVRRGRR